MEAPRAVLITGVFGSGKTTVVEELAEMLEDAGLPYAAIDLDWLMWFAGDDLDRDGERDVLAANLKAVAGNYRARGVRYFLLALFLQSQHDLTALEQAIGMDLTVVRLECPADVIRQRLAAAPTRGWARDLRRALVALEQHVGQGLEDLVVANEGTLADTAATVLDHLGWVRLPS